jgi:hypothetical protein
MTGPGRSLHNIHYQTRSGSWDRRLAGLSALLLFAGLVVSCTQPSPSEPTGVPVSPGQAGETGPSGPAGQAAQADSPAPPPAAPVPPTAPPRLPVVAVEARRGAAATSIPVDGASIPTIDPGSTFEVRLPFAVRGARLVLLDARDAMLPSSAETEVGATSRFTLVPLEPLLPGSRHVLRLVGVETRLVKADDGRSFEPLAAPFRVSGEPPAAPPKKAKKKRTG